MNGIEIENKSEPLTEATMENFLLVYNGNPMETVNGTGGWVYKRAMIEGYGALMNYSSYANCNDYYNRVKSLWEEVKVGVRVYCRPRSDWKKSLPNLVTKNVTVLHSLISSLTMIDRAKNTVAALRGQMSVYQSHFQDSQFPGVVTDMMKIVGEMRDDIQFCYDLLLVEEGEEE